VSAPDQEKRAATNASPTVVNIVGTNHMITRVISRCTCSSRGARGRSGYPQLVGRCAPSDRYPAAVTHTETITPTQAPERERTDEGDHDRFAHYAKKDAIARAYVTGEAIVALCGKKWVPTRDPSRYPICPTCKELKEAGWTLR
jgi:Protein of unknown function (DUF3039)